jgi:hypothetical protein
VKSPFRRARQHLLGVNLFSKGLEEDNDDCQLASVDQTDAACSRSEVFEQEQTEETEINRPKEVTFLSDVNTPMGLNSSSACREGSANLNSDPGLGLLKVLHGFVWSFFVGQDLSWRELVSIAVPGQVLAYISRDLPAGTDKEIS